MHRNQWKTMAGVLWAIIGIVSAFTAVYCECWWLLALSVIGVILSQLLLNVGSDHSEAIGEP